MSEAAKGYVWHSTASMPFHALGFTCSLAESPRAYGKHLGGYVLGDISVRGDIPRSMWISDDAPPSSKRVKALPQTFVAGSYFVVSEKAAEVFNNFDLGSSALLPVEVLKLGRKAAFDGQFYIFHITESKSAFLPDQSVNYVEPRSEEDEWAGFVRLEETNGDEIAVAASALDGPEVWKDPTLLETLFFSDPLYAALSKADVLGNAQTIHCRAV